MEVLVLAVKAVAAAVVGCGPEEARGAESGAGSGRTGTGPAAGAEAGSESDSGPVGGFGLETASVDELASGLVRSTVAVVSAETVLGLAGGPGLALGFAGSGFVGLGQSSAPGSAFARRSSSPWTPEYPSESVD